jgi:hypothetical protein
MWGVTGAEEYQSRNQDFSKMLSRRPLRLVLPRFRAAELHIFTRRLPANTGSSMHGTGFSEAAVQDW